MLTKAFNDIFVPGADSVSTQPASYTCPTPPGGPIGSKPFGGGGGSGGGGGHGCIIICGGGGSGGGTVGDGGCISFCF